MDGTLVDSNALVDQMWTEFATTVGADVDAVVRFAHGTPSIATLRRFLTSEAEIAAWFARITEWEKSRFGSAMALPGAVDVVRSLAPERWAVVTSAVTAAAVTRLAEAGFPAPRVLVGATDVRAGKPHPEGFLAAADALGVDPARCVVFEDSPAGIEAGLAAGCHVVVRGDLDHPVTVGLARLHEWTGVTAVTAPDGAITFHGIPAA